MAGSYGQQIGSANTRLPAHELAVPHDSHQSDIRVLCEGKWLSSLQLGITHL